MPKISKIFFLFIVFCLLFSVYHPTAYSMSPLEQAQQDYTYQVTKLIEIHDKFLTAKASYLTYKTATSKNEAYSKMKDYLAQSHNAILTYLALVEERTNLFDWSLSSYKKDDIAKQLHDERDYIKASLDNTNNAQTLEDLISISQKLSDRTSNTTFVMAIRVLETSEVAQMEDAYSILNQTNNNLDNELKDKINDTNKPFYDNWKSEIEKMKSQIQDQIISSKKLLPRGYSVRTIFINLSIIENSTQTVKQALLKAKSLMAEFLYTI